jgi:hypothetical protein
MKDEAGNSNLKIRAYQVHPVATARTWFFPRASATNLPTTAVLGCMGIQPARPWRSNAD